MKLNLFEQRLIALSRLHYKGLSSIAASLGYSKGTFSLFVSGQRPIPEKTRTALGNELAFEECGFNDQRLESWLARSVEDLARLQELGFIVSPLTKLVSSRDIAAQKDRSKKGAQHQFLIARVSFIRSHRDVIVRATREKMIEFLATFPDELNLREMEFDYAKRERLYKICDVVKKDLTPSCTPLSEQPTVLLDEIQSLEKAINRMVAEDRRAVSCDLSTSSGAEPPTRLRRHRLYVRTVRKVFGISRSENVPGGHAVRKNGNKVEVEVHPIFVGETSELIEDKRPSDTHLVVIKEHVTGMLEVVFEGPRNIIFETNEADTIIPSRSPSGRSSEEVRRGRKVSVKELRDLNSRVHSDQRLTTTEDDAREDSPT